MESKLIIDEEIQEFVTAIQQNNMEVFINLLPHMQRKINQPDRFDYRPIHYSCWYNRVEMTKQLMAIPTININIQVGAYDWTPLHFACRHNRIEIVKLLLQEPNLDLSLRSIHYKTALQIAELHKRDEIVELINSRSAISSNATQHGLSSLTLHQNDSLVSFNPPKSTQPSSSSHTASQKPASSSHNTANVTTSKTNSNTINPKSNEDCCICMEEPKGAALFPCGHFKFCCSCAEELHQSAKKECPICRTTIIGWAKIFQ